MEKTLVREEVLFDVWDLRYTAEECYCPEPMTMRCAIGKAGGHIGLVDYAEELAARGIKPELSSPDKQTCSIGFSEAEQKWYGWSHRGMCGFGMGHVVAEGNCETSSGLTPAYLADHPEADRSVPVGFTVESMFDAKQVAIAFADSIR